MATEPNDARIFWRLVGRAFGETMTGRHSAPYAIFSGVVSVASVILAVSVDSLPIIWRIGLVAAPFLLSLLAYFVFAAYMVWKEERNERMILADRLTPKLRLDFDANGDGIILTPIKIQKMDLLSSQPSFTESYGAYIRIRLTALSDLTVRSCSVFLTEIENKTKRAYSLPSECRRTIG